MLKVKNIDPHIVNNLNPLKVVNVVTKTYIKSANNVLYDVGVVLSYFGRGPPLCA